MKWELALVKREGAVGPVEYCGNFDFLTTTYNIVSAFVLAIISPLVGGMLNGSIILPIQYYLQDALVAFIAVVLIAEGVRFASLLSLEKYGWLRYGKPRLLIGVSFAIIYSAMVVTFIFYVYVIKIYERPFFSSVYTYYLSTGILIGLLYSGVWNGYLFFNEWRQNEHSLNELKRENLNTKYELLKSQFNPHFLFNSLSILRGLIRQNAAQAVYFVDELSIIFRYSLDERDSKWVTLEKDIQMVEAYLNIIRLRYPESIDAEIKIPEKLMRGACLPVGVLQILVENAIKHNAFSSTKKLKLEVYDNKDMLVVKNNINKKIGSNRSKSFGIGLKAVRRRYELLSTVDIKITQNVDAFIVELPLAMRKDHENSDC